MSRLSIVIPSERPGLTAYARLLQAMHWAGPQVEVVIRDSSGDPAKAAFFAGIARDNVRFQAVAPCSRAENWREAVQAASGDFVYPLSDDDLCMDRALEHLPAVIDGIVDDPAIIGIAGPTLIESARGSELFAYPNVDAGDPLVRLSGYLSAPGANALLHAPVRRATLRWATGVIGTRPFALPFDDRITVLLHLLSGKYARVKRLMNVHEAGGAGEPAAAQRRDGDAYLQAGLDAATNRLHWFLCGFEGACLVRNMTLPPNPAPALRQSLADLWFSTLYARFRTEPRQTFGSPLAGAAEALCARWRDAAGQLSFADMLAEICQFLALSSQDNALKYFAFWGTLLGLRKAA